MIYHVGIDKIESFFRAKTFPDELESSVSKLTVFWE